jgi:hypothetical protein
MMEAILSSEKLFKENPHGVTSHEVPKSYIALTGWTL